MELPTESRYRECIEGVIDRTSNEALATAVCMVCAREVDRTETRSMAVRDIPNAHRLRPENPCRFWDLIDGLGLHTPALVPGCEARGSVCSECLRELRKDLVPSVALANNMWIGAVPFDLDVLSMPEKVLIALYFPTAFIYKLYPKKKRWNPDHLQTGYRANVSTYKLDTKEIASFISSNQLPHQATVLSSVIAVTFVGPKNIPERCMKGIFRVKRHRVHRALIWLKEHNPLYHNVEINDELLAELPEDGVPSSIMLNVRCDPGENRADRSTGYVPEVGDDDGECLSH